MFHGLNPAVKDVVYTGWAIIFLGPEVLYGAAKPKSLDQLMKQRSTGRMTSPGGGVMCSSRSSAGTVIPGAVVFKSEGIWGDGGFFNVNFRRDTLSVI
jgi:hypothetical protein